MKPLARPLLLLCSDPLRIILPGLSHPNKNKNKLYINPGFPLPPAYHCDKVYNRCGLTKPRCGITAQTTPNLVPNRLVKLGKSL
jgi:hypothetical protein